jgi:hypothetical protein
MMAKSQLQAHNWERTLISSMISSKKKITLLMFSLKKRITMSRRMNSSVNKCLSSSLRNKVAMKNWLWRWSRRSSQFNHRRTWSVSNVITLMNWRRWSSKRIQRFSLCRMESRKWTNNIWCCRTRNSWCRSNRIKMVLESIMPKQKPMKSSLETSKRKMMTHFTAQMISLRLSSLSSIV